MRYLRHASCLALGLIVSAYARPAHAQDNYEIQVYGADLIAPGHTIFELHSNFTARGRTAVVDSVLPSNHALHETLEITHGMTPWLEVGWYLFTSLQSGGGYNIVGTHIRPRVRAPEAWHWPVGVSLSFEAGYQRRGFSTDTWSLEIRPIVDKQMGPVYWALNPTIERALKGEGTSSGFEFSPNATVGVDVDPLVNLALEYYGAFGPISNFAPAAQQEQQLFPAVNLHLAPQFEFNFGIGFGLTSATDKTIVKMITGYRF